MVEIFTWLPLALSLAGTGVAPTACDPGLLGNVDSELAYKLRGDRCEGIYKLEVNSTELRLDALVETFEQFDAEAPEDLTIAWSVPPGTRERQVRLQANALLPRAFYRMDAVVAAPTTSFAWPADFLASQKFGRDDLGVLGWLEPAESGGEKLYLPLRIHQRKAAVRSGIYELAVTPRVRLDEVYVTVVPVASAGGAATAAPIWKAKPLEFGPYQAGSPVFFELPALAATGVYRVEVQATYGEGGSTIYELFLYHERG